MPRIPLLGGAYQARSVIAEAQRCVNLYPEKNPTDAPTQVTHYPTPGLRYLAGPVPPVPPGGFAPLGVHFDGNTLVTNAALSCVDSPFLTYSYWFNVADDQSSSFNWLIGVENFFDTVGSGNITGSSPQINLNNGLGDVLVFGSDADAAFGSWHHVIYSVDINHAAGARIFKVYVDDVDVTAVSGGNDNGNAFVILANGQLFQIGGEVSVGLRFLTGDLAEFWWGLGQFIDLTVTANRRKFLSAAGAPVDLGADGSAPTGTAPTIYCSRRPGDLPVAFATDRGTGGVFAVSVGALTAAATAPHL